MRSAADLAAAFDGKPGIWVADPTQSDPIFTANPDEPFVTASLYKLALLLHVERLVEAGRLSYKDTITIEEDDVRHGGANEYPGTVLTIDDALEAMITYSDNGPALAFLRMFGAVSINGSLAAQKIADFHVAVRADDDNVVTPRALATYFTLLSERRLVSTAASGRMLARLRRQHVNDRLPRDLPAGVTVAHKTGDLVGYTHDVGIIDVPGAQLVVVAMTSGGREQAAYDFIARLGWLAYSAYAPDPARLPTPAPVIALQPAQREGANLVLVGLVVGAFGGLLVVRRFARRSGVHRRVPRGSRPLGVWTPSRRRGTGHASAGASGVLGRSIAKPLVTWAQPGPVNQARDHWRRDGTSKGAAEMAAPRPTARKSAAMTAGGKKDRKGQDLIDDYLAQQPADKRALLEKLRALVMRGVPDAEVSIKWGVPFYAKDGKNVCALASFKDHVGINFFATPEVLVDPAGKLEGSGKGNRMLKVRTAEDIDNAAIRRWLKAAVAAGRPQSR